MRSVAVRMCQESLHRLLITTHKKCVFFVYMIVHLIYLFFLMRLSF